VVARASFVRNAPRKLRLVADAVRGLSPLSAIEALKHLPQRGARPVRLVLEQAMGNAKNNAGFSPDRLLIDTIQVMGGPRVAKKSDVHARGARFGRGTRVKRLSHVLVRLKEV